MALCSAPPFAPFCSLPRASRLSLGTPTRLANGEELWVLATIPRKGPPRPNALGIKKAGETAVRRLSLD